MGRTPADIMDELLAVAAEHDAWDDESFNPHSPETVAKTLAVPEAIPFLVETLEGSDPRRRGWAIYALSLLGPRAGTAAADALARLEHIALFKVDEARARALGLHKRRQYRADIMRQMLEREPEQTAKHLAELLEDADQDLVLFALGVSDTVRTDIENMAQRRPDRFPVAQVRRHLASESMPVRIAAATILDSLHQPEDAAPFLEALASGQIVLRQSVADWVGSLPLSDRLFTRGRGIQEIFEIVRRRRCAGRTTTLGILGGIVTRVLETPVAGSSRADQNDVEYAARIVQELHLVDFASLVAVAVGPPDDARRFEGEGPYDEILAVLASLGSAGSAAVDAALAAAPAGGRRHERLGWMKDALAKHGERKPYYTVAVGDARFAEGKLEDPTLVDSAAYGAYARALLDDPGSAHAAFQLAWIDRGFGTPIDDARIEWLRGLGVRDHLLGELARRPEGVMPGYRFGHREGSGYPEDRPTIARLATLAGLHGIAAVYCEKKSVEASLARDAAAAHLALVQRGCAR